MAFGLMRQNEQRQTLPLTGKTRRERRRDKTGRHAYKSTETDQSLTVAAVAFDVPAGGHSAGDACVCGLRGWCGDRNCRRRGGIGVCTI